MSPRKLRPGGGYRSLRSFQVTTLIYDGTVAFCDRHLDRRSRTHDQMVQAARSGRQNIAEGNRMGSTSSKSELHLTNVARSSLEELLLDYEDYLRQHQLPLWKPDSPEAQAVRQALWRSDSPISEGTLSDPGDDGDRARWQIYQPWLDHTNAAVTANAQICLIHQANYLLDQQIIALEQAFIEGGGYTETLATARLRHRSTMPRGDQPDQSDPSDQTDSSPRCPECGGLTVVRTARIGRNAGSRFWGCTAYPDCKGVVPM